MSARQLRIVGVDDSEDDLLLLERALRQASSLSLAAGLRDGAQAIAYLSGDQEFSNRLQWPLPDILVLDIKMPNVDGFDVLNWLQQQPQKRFKVVILTSSLADADKTRALAMGADAVYIKPPDPAGYRALARMLEAHVSQP
jgi:CheY-like chemotaxis protein